MAIATPVTPGEVYLNRILNLVNGKEIKLLKNQVSAQGLTYIAGFGKGYVFNGSQLGLRFSFGDDGKVNNVNYAYVANKKCLEYWRAGNRNIILMPEAPDTNDPKTAGIMNEHRGSLDKLLKTIEGVSEHG